MNELTARQYDSIIGKCRDIFEKKTRDYGTAWRIMRVSSMTDQIFIKAQRIRSIQEKGTQKVEEGVAPEFLGIINYCLLALIQLKLVKNERLNMSLEELTPHYEEAVKNTKALLENKNHDYNEAWRDMRVSSITDIILMKLLRVKQIEDNAGQTLISEGVDANYQDMINYSVFALILLNEA